MDGVGDFLLNSDMIWHCYFLVDGDLLDVFINMVLMFMYMSMTIALMFIQTPLLIGLSVTAGNCGNYQYGHCYETQHVGQTVFQITISVLLIQNNLMLQKTGKEMIIRVKIGIVLRRGRIQSV